MKGPGSEAECYDIEEEEEGYYIFNFSNVTDILTSYELEIKHHEVLQRMYNKINCIRQHCPYY